MKNFKENLRKYAQLAVKVGVNLQQDQTLVINCSLDAAELVRLIVKEAYQNGAYNVIVNWSDDIVTRLKYDLAPEEAFNEYPLYRAKEIEELAEQGACFMSIISASPDLLKGVSPGKIGAFQKAAGKALHKYRQYISSDQVSWTVIAAASEQWAKQVFPNDNNATLKLWQEIFTATRVNKSDPVQAWLDHDQSLHKIVSYLNDKNYSTLHFTAPGTDLKVDLPENHLWVGAGSTNAKGIPFMANMPTEEVFTVPLKTGVNGYVSSTKPLSYSGNIINNFKLTFKNGEIVNIEAEQGAEILQQLINTDEGAKFLGEVALVPNNSPISKAGVLFYNTLFDENASNHLAIGNSYAFCIKDGKEMSAEELASNGLNESIVHVDFMIGSAEMDVNGINAKGEIEPIFIKGNWAANF